MTEKHRTTPLPLEEGLIELRAKGRDPLWIWARTCPTPNCDCRTASVVVSRSGKDALVQAAAGVKPLLELDTAFTKVERLLGEDCAVFSLDIDTVEAGRGELEQVQPLLERSPWLSEVIERINGEALDQIGRLWFRGKGLDAEEKPQPLDSIPGWVPGMDVSWDQAYLGFRQDFFVFDAQAYEAIEQYCVLPDCDCGKVEVRFDVEGSSDKVVGSVIIDTAGVCQLLPAAGPPELLERLWAAYQKRHPMYRERHAGRYPRMRTFGTLLLAHSADTGPNDPCPCGSGKKYKKCCWKKTLLGVK